MSRNYPAATLRAARHVLAGKWAEIQHLMTGDEPAAWDMIRAYAEEMVEAGKVAHLELADWVQKKTEVPLGLGQQALEAIAAGPNDAATDEAMDEIEAHIASLEAEGIAEREAVAEAERINRSHPDPFFQPFLTMVRPPHLAEGA